ncbi:hypothetical protein Ddye_009380 [Dipteronia dyeriana]|uniref:RNase H type-1 domain-containing protein n=1 Tax=Dipteronia dyeriana TaxID=168575 RepID=A0AAD9XBI8_9ROSI|nr:hypothetical protein Ddye_009380 [Dipteronia dyeriana]
MRFCQGNSTDRGMVVSSWSPPPLGVFKINTDAAIAVAKIRTGIGIIVKDSSGDVMASFAQMVRVNYEPQIAEAIAILKVNSDIGIIVHDILSLLGNFRECSVVFVPRKANMVAHFLAKEGLFSESDDFWLEEVPRCMSPLVLRVCSNSL